MFWINSALIKGEIKASRPAKESPEVEAYGYGMEPKSMNWNKSLNYS